MFEHLICSIKVWMRIRYVQGIQEDQSLGVFWASLKLKFILFFCVLSVYSLYYSFITRNSFGMPKAWMKSMRTSSYVRYTGLSFRYVSGGHSKNEWLTSLVPNSHCHQSRTAFFSAKPGKSSLHSIYQWQKKWTTKHKLKLGKLKILSHFYFPPRVTG